MLTQGALVVLNIPGVPSVAGRVVSTTTHTRQGVPLRAPVYYVHLKNRPPNSGYFTSDFMYFWPDELKTL